MPRSARDHAGSSEPAPPGAAWPRWLVFGGALAALGLAGLAAPARFEGPVLLPVSPGHAISLLDALALVPLLAGIHWIEAGLWRERGRLRARTLRSPGRSLALVFGAGAGLGLLLGSVLPWRGLWGVGAALLGATLTAAALLATRPPR